MSRRFGVGAARGFPGTSRVLGVSARALSAGGALGRFLSSPQHLLMWILSHLVNGKFTWICVLKVVLQVGSERERDSGGPAAGVSGSWAVVGFQRFLTAELERAAWVLASPLAGSVTLDELLRCSALSVVRQ